MNTEFPIYAKSGKEVVEINEDSWTSISKHIDEKYKSI